MSLDPKSIHVRIPPEMHERLIVLAGLDNREVAAHAAMLLEKMIVAEWHAITLQVDRMRRLGLTGIHRDSREPGPMDKDDRITCRQCVNLSRDACLAARRGEISASRMYEPSPDLPRRCEGYVPGPDDPDRRTGRERWPNSDYPARVCISCGRRYGHNPYGNKAATWHYGGCGVCGENGDVTEPRDFGHLKPEWRSRLDGALKMGKEIL